MEEAAAGKARLPTVERTDTVRRDQSHIIMQHSVCFTRRLIANYRELLDIIGGIYSHECHSRQ